MTPKPCSCTPQTYGIMSEKVANSAKSGLAMPGCMDPPKCTDYLIYKTEVAPVLNDTSTKLHVPLNTQFGANINPMFQARVGMDGRLQYSINNDRLLDNKSFDQLYLDRPPFDSKISQEQIYDDAFSRGRVGFYNDVSDIKGGNDKYYVDLNIAPPYIAPTFVLPGTVNYELFTDPMSTVRPQYPRNLLNATNYNVNPYQTLRDEMMFREDILSRKYQTENQRRFDSRWFS